MKSSAMFKFAAVLLATVGMMIPNYALGADIPATVSVQDVALSSGGIFAGQVVDAQGIPVANSVVLIISAISYFGTLAAQKITRTNLADGLGG